MNSFFGDVSSGSRNRELFPLPKYEEVPHEKGRSGSSRRRKAKVRQNVEQTNSIIETLNKNDSPSHDGSFCSTGCMAAQAAAQPEIFKAVARCPLPTTILSEREAVKELLQTSLAYVGTEASTMVRPYNRGLISIPSGGHCAVCLGDVLDESGRDLVEDPSRCMLLSDDEWGEVIENQEGFTPCMDETLRKDPLKYILL